MGLFLNRWRALRLLLALLISFSLLSAYIYLKSRPSYALYHELTRLELQQSQDLVGQLDVSAIEKRRYVRFRQLQGAGFNNQVRTALLTYHIHMLIKTLGLITGSRNSALPPSSSCIFPYLCVPTSSLARSWRTFIGTPVCLFARCHTQLDQ